jgi:hypothetical protein
MPQISDRIRSLLFGLPFGTVFPPSADPPSPVVDGRTAALRILKEYISELTFLRDGGQGPGVSFKVKDTAIFIDSYPDAVTEGQLPSIAFVPGRAEYVALGLGNFIEEASQDVYGAGTVVQWQAEYTENMTLEIWAGSRAERRAILVGLESALSPTETMYGIRFSMPDYFNQLVCFSLGARTNIDDAEASKNRRKARMEIEMRFNVIALVNYSAMIPRAVVETQDPGFPFATATVDAQD